MRAAVLTCLTLLLGACTASTAGGPGPAAIGSARSSAPQPSASGRPGSSMTASTSAPSANSSSANSSSGSASSIGSAPAASTGNSSTGSSSTAGDDLAADSRIGALLASMTLRQKVGQLLMVDCPSTGVSAATVRAIRRNHVGAIILDGNSRIGRAATRQVVDTARAHAPARTGLLVATDQEGGLVQRLQGPGFDTIPSALQQGRVSPDVLRTDAARWGRQLRRAGVDVNLAPVLDTVPRGDTNNPPIGDLDREYGHTPRVVSRHGVAVVRGLADAGVAATVKHFPGLGRVTGNTDTTSGVVDRVTRWNDPYLGPFQHAVSAGTPLVMMSTAIYARIDRRNPAAFSHTIVTKLLRDRMGFGGVVISDDVGHAAQVSGYPVGARAVRFVAAGGDIVLTVDAGQAGVMTQALARRARRSPSFAAQVDRAVTRVLRLKQQFGVLG